MNAVVILSLCAITRGIIIQTEYKQEENLTSPLVTLSFNKSININEGTFCLEFYLLENLGNYFLFSTTSGRNTFSLFFVLEENYGILYFPTKSFIFLMSNIWPFEWFNFCFTYKNYGYYIVTNGEIWDSKPISIKNDLKHSEYHFIESLTIASLNTGQEVFPGKINRLNIWNYTMTIDDLKIITTSCTKLQKPPNIFEWSKINKKQLTIANDELAKFVNQDEGMCYSENEVKVKLYTALYDYESAKHICEVVSAEIYFPKTKEELIKISNDASSDQNYNQCGQAVLLPIYLNDHGEWINNSNQPYSSTQLKWAKGEPNGGGRQRCVVATKTYDFYDVFCNSKRCPICKWTKNPVFFLKGLCPQSNIEYRFVLRINERYQGSLVFKGFSNDYYIVFDKNKQAYVLAKSIRIKDQYRPISNDEIIGVSFAKYNSLPIGLQSWEINDGICNQTVQLKFTSVRLYTKMIIDIEITCFFSVQYYTIYL